MNIGEKLFTYIDNHNQLTVEMIEQYRNSLIFLGDEQQIFQPLTGTYVGVGLSYLNQMKQEIQGDLEKLKELDAHIHQNVVNSLWANFNLEQFNNAIPTSGITKWVSGSQKGYGDGYELMTNQDLVVKGLHDTQISSDGNGHKFIEKKANDELGNAFDDNTNTNNQTLWSHIDRTKYTNSNYKGSSGIQVNVHHTGSYKVGTDEHGFAYSYFEGQDYLTIDDSLTWAYITSQSSYLMDFSKKVAVSQANRVYHDILGGNDPVYIEKAFNEAFESNEYGELETIVKDGAGDVYIHIKDTTNNTGGSYKKVAIHNGQDGYYYIYAQLINPTDGNPYYYVIKTNNPSPSSTITGVDDGIGGTTRTLTYLTPDQLTDSANAGTSSWKPILHPDDGWDRNNDGTFKEVAWYHYDADATAQGRLNLADGIQTLREVSYILDRITDGNPDDVITLTYNIAKNAHDIDDISYWKSHIGSYIVTGIDGSSHNQFVYVNTYSSDQWGANDSPATGYTKIDVDILTAQTYVLNIDGVNVSYAAYLNTPSHLGQLKTIWRPLGDTTNEDYYIQLSATNSNATERAKLVTKLKEVYGNLSNINIFTKTTSSTTGLPEYTVSTSMTADNIGSTTNFADDKYVLFNYEQINYPIVGNVIDGLTTVNWVTTYFGHAAEDIMSRVTTVNDDVKEWMLTYIHDNYNVSYTDGPGQFVAKVRQVEGRVEVEYKKLPLDTILASQEIYGNDFFVPITFDRAQELVYPDGPANTASPFYERVYFLDGTDYKHPSGNLNTITQYYVIAKANKFTQIDLTNISDSNGPQTITNALLLNGGGFTYFQRSSNYQIVNGSTTTKVMAFNPVDINELIAAASPNNYISSSILEELYYYNASTDASPFTKYFDAYSRQNTENGGTEIYVSTYVTYLGAATKSNTGLADAYDVRHTIESMVTFINLKTNKPIKSSADL